MFAMDDEMMTGARIKVIGVGGAGGNAVNTMIQSGLEGIEFIVANTDAQALENSLADLRIQLGANVTRGLGAGAKPDVGKSAASENQARIAEALEGADMVFVTAGMGGGTGTGAAPVIAKIARDQGALTVGVVTRPFAFEGRRRARMAEEGLLLLEEEVDTLIIIPNERLLAIAGPDTTFLDAFRHADRVLYNGVQGVSELITTPGYINVDFADVKSVMSDRGMALMGTGIASGEGRARIAAEEAIASPLLEDANIDGATGVLINITGGLDLTIQEGSEAAELIHSTADPEANVIFGTVFDENMTDEVKVTVIATGFRRERDPLSSSGGDALFASRRDRERDRDRERERERDREESRSRDHRPQQRNTQPMNPAPERTRERRSEPAYAVQSAKPALRASRSEQDPNNDPRHWIQEQRARLKNSPENSSNHATTSEIHEDEFVTVGENDERE